MTDFATVLIGISLTIISSLCANFSIILEKKAFLSDKNIPQLSFQLEIGEFIKAFLTLSKNKYWISGFIIGFIKWGLYIFALALIGIAIVQPIMSIGIIILVFFGKKVFDEKFNYYEIASVIALAISPIVIAFAGASNMIIEIETLLIKISSFLIFLVVVTIFLVIISRFNKNQEFQSIYYAVISAFFYSIGVVFVNVFLSLYSSLNNINIFNFFDWINILTGFFSFDIKLTWMAICFWSALIFVFLGLVFLQFSIQRGRTVIIYLVYNIIRILIPVFVGVLIFGIIFEFVLLFYLGLVFSILAIVILSKYPYRLITINE